MKGRINSIYTGSALDGPGIRTVVFFQGCPLRCIYCHNPETHDFSGGEEIEAEVLFSKLNRYCAYYGKNGGVTFSGGEALCQAEFLCEILELCKGAGIHTALDTSGCVDTPAAKRAVQLADLVILDIKMNSEEDYKRYTGGSFSAVLDFLEFCGKAGTDTWLRKVIVPGINDTKQCVSELAHIAQTYKCVKKTELLPFEKLCTEKYKRLGITFPLEDTPAMDKAALAELEKILYAE
ncbi:MAG: pyruvate formate lyase-activating protein [Clostridia bacterium]|nr:pyruvate formate lyase-activating protein [Clostridia bacterium]